MSTSQESTGAPVPRPAATAGGPAAAPTQYHLHGGGIAVSYYPQGTGHPPSGGARLIYQDAHRSLNFNGEEIRTVEVPDLGTIVSVSLVRTVDIGFTSFSLLVPQVVVPPHAGAVPVNTEGVTTVHRILAGAIGHAQRETYAVTPLTGTASAGFLHL